MSYTITIPIKEAEFMQVAVRWLVDNIGPQVTELTDDDTPDKSIMTGKGWQLVLHFRFDEMQIDVEFVMEDESDAVIVALMANDWL